MCTTVTLGLFLSDAFAQIISKEGIGTLWNGTLPSLILVLNPAVQFMFYEAMKRKAGRADKKVRGEALLCRILQNAATVNNQPCLLLIYKLLTK